MPRTIARKTYPRRRPRTPRRRREEHAAWPKMARGSTSLGETYLADDPALPASIVASWPLMRSSTSYPPKPTSSGAAALSTYA